ncbi:hypothetical protein ACFE04_016643 [Oxalis oulophora]
MASNRRLPSSWPSGSESFKGLDVGIPKKGESVETKVCWVRSQIIGSEAEFTSPFGIRLITYADHTASGRSLHYIEDYIVNNVLPFYGNTHSEGSFVGRGMTKMLQEATHYIKRCLGGGLDTSILLCGSGATAAIKRLQEVMGISVPSTLRNRIIKTLRSEERWLVFVGPYEHHSNVLSWRQSLAEVIEIGVDENGLVDLDSLRQRLEFYKDANRPILGSFSACSNVTGIYVDTRAIATLFHRYGGFVCFDFAASSGPYVEIDMRFGHIDGYDAVFLSPHKFLGGPGSPGILLMSNALYQLGSSPPSTCGGGTVNYVNGFNERVKSYFSSCKYVRNALVVVSTSSEKCSNFQFFIHNMQLPEVGWWLSTVDTLYLSNIEERENSGTPPIIQTIRAALAFWVKECVGHQVIMKHEDSYIEKALQRLQSNPYIKILGNTSTKRQAILSFLIYSTTNPNPPEMKNNKVLDLWKVAGGVIDKPLHGAFVAILLNDLFGIQSRDGCACAGPYGHSLLNIDKTQSLAYRDAIQKGFVGVKPGWTRISFPYYMSNEEFEFIIAAVEFIATYGQRFLALYHMDFKTGSWSFKKSAFKELTQNRHNIDITSLTNDMKEINITPHWHKHKKNEGEDLIKKYSSYLETANYIAKLLPRFPSYQKFHEDLDYNLIYYRV